MESYYEPLTIYQQIVSHNTFKLNNKVIKHNHINIHRTLSLRS